MQKSSKAVQSNFRANMRAVKDGSVSLVGIVSSFFVGAGALLLAVPLMVLTLGGSLWLMVHSPLAAVLLVAAFFIYC